MPRGSALNVPICCSNIIVQDILFESLMFMVNMLAAESLDMHGYGCEKGGFLDEATIILILRDSPQKFPSEFLIYLRIALKALRKHVYIGISC